MSLILKDRCKQKVAANAGTNSITLTTAVTGFKTISSTLSNGDSSYFCLESGSSWEVFIGTYTSSTTTVSRDTVLASSNSGNKIDIGSGITVCYIVYPADKATYKDGSGRIVSGAAGIIFSDASIQTTAATTPDLSAYAPLASPTFTGTPAAPTATSGTNTTQLATTAFVASAVGSIDLTPYALLPDTLPAVGTLLSYGGSRQLAAGGTVTHSGALNLDANALTCGRISTRQSGTGINIETNGLISGDAWPSNDYGFVKIQNSVNIGRGLYNRLNAGSYNNGIMVQGTNSTSIGIQFASASQAQGSPLSHLLYTVGSGFALLGSDATTPMSLSCGAITASGVVTATSFATNNTVAGGINFGASYGAITMFGGGQIAFRSTLGGLAGFIIGNAQGGFDATGNQIIGNLHTAYLTDMRINGGGTYIDSQTAGSIYLHGGSNYAGGTNSNGGSAYLHGGAGSGSGTTGKTHLAWDGSAARGRVLVGTGTDDGASMLQVAGAITASGQLSANASGLTATFGPISGTAVQYAYIGNGTGKLWFGVESSAGGGLFTGGSAYAAVVGTSSTTSFQIATNNTVRTTWDSSGNATFTGDITLSTGVISLSSDRRIICGAANSPLRFIYTNAADAALTCGAITASGVVSVNGVTLTGNSSYGLLYSSASIVAEGFWASSGSENKVWVSNAHGTRVASGLGFQFATNQEVSNPPDLQLTRQSAGVLQIGTTSANALGSLACGAITASGTVTTTALRDGGLGDHYLASITHSTGFNYFSLNSNGLNLGNTAGIRFYGALNVLGTPDTTLTRNAAGVLQVGTTTANASGSLLLTNINASGYGDFNGTVFANGANGVRITTRVYLLADSDGALRITNNSQSAAASLSCGAITSSGLLSLVNGTTAQCIKIYSTYASEFNYEALTLAPTTSAINIGLQVGSAGGTNTRNINIGHWDTFGTFITRFTSATSVTQAISDTTCVFRLYGHGGVATGTQIQCYKARGADRNTKTYPLSGDIFGGLNCYGYDENAANWSTSKGAYIISASGDWTSTANGTQHTWQVTNSTDATKTLTTVMTLNAAGVLSTLCGINSSKLIRQNAEVTYTPTGITQTITLNDGNHQTLNLTSATGTVAVTLTVPTSSSAGTIIVNQHASAAKDLTWAVSSGTIRWMGAEPDWAADAISSDRLVSWRWNGSIMRLVATDVGT